uniref:Uncharacterized protein n=1 Tax=Romanomermis culicivorax TaxID=13658 RepID=A0A915KJW3_ROMCU
MGSNRVPNTLKVDRIKYIAKVKIRYEPVDFPAVTFCTGYQSEFSQIQNNASKTKLKLTSVSKSVDFYSTESLSERRTTASTKKYNRQKRKEMVKSALRTLTHATVLCTMILFRKASFQDANYV